MLRPLRTLLPVFFLAFVIFGTGCATLYRRQIYHPYRSNYQKPPEKKEAGADLLPPATDSGAPNPAPVPDAGALPGGAPAPAAPAPGMLDAPPAIPGLPQP